MSRSRLPRHIGFIPDGNRRWAASHGLSREHGYHHGVGPGLELFELCSALQIPEVSVYGFTQDNTRRPTVQTAAFKQACIEFAVEVATREVSVFLCVRRGETFPRRRTALATYRPTRWESRSPYYATPFVNLSS